MMRCSRSVYRAVVSPPSVRPSSDWSSTTTTGEGGAAQGASGALIGMGVGHRREHDVGLGEAHLNQTEAARVGRRIPSSKP